MTVMKESHHWPKVDMDELRRGIAGIEYAGNTDAKGEVSMITADSREVCPGALFVAVRGYCTDGHRYICNALERGAVAVVCEEFPENIVASCLYIRVHDTRKALAEAARLYYGGASDRLLIVGVTGTNGKTTTARLITEMFNACGIPAGYIGTHLCRINGQDIVLDHTTPEAPGLHALFRRMVDAGCRAAVMEVSSHALALHRVYGITFHLAVFTNLTMEHLDFHESMQEYASAKQQLFDQLAPEGVAVFNSDDPYAAQMAERVATGRRYCCTLNAVGSSSLFPCRHSFKAEILHATLESSTVAITFPDTVQTMQVGLPGAFNVMNVLEAAAAGTAMGLDAGTICASLSAVVTVNGRMERIGEGAEGRSVFVDYAHTPDALFKALDTLRTLKPEGSRLVVVFGCGGNRDRTKRAEMGRIASEIADEVIITSDNPRDEDPDSILDEIEEGIATACHSRISDRNEAIKKAVSMLRRGDVLLVAGKGHEQYQEIASRKYFFSDQERLRYYMQEKSAGYPEKEKV